MNTHSLPQIHINNKLQGHFGRGRVHTLDEVCMCVLQCVAVCCSVLQCVAVCCSASQCFAVFAVCYSMLQFVAVCCSMLHCVILCCNKLQGHLGRVRVDLLDEVCMCGVQCVTVFCSLLQYVAVWHSTLQNVTEYYNTFQCNTVYCKILRGQFGRARVPTLDGVCSCVLRTCCSACVQIFIYT